MERGVAGNEYCLKKRDGIQWYSVYGEGNRGHEGCVCLTEQSFSKFIIRGVDACRDRSVSKPAI